MALHPHIHIISIDGNIGSGKTTLLHHLQDSIDTKAKKSITEVGTVLHGTNKSYIFLKEPIDEWNKIKNSAGVTILELFYADQETHAFPFQMMAYISRLALLKKAVDVAKEKLRDVWGAGREQPPALLTRNHDVYIITERNLYTDRHVFAKMLHDAGKINDVNYQIYDMWFNEFAEMYKPECTVYVRASPETCYDRVHKRNRTGEEVIPLSYLTQCHNYHETMMLEIGQQDDKHPILMLDGDECAEENPILRNAWTKRLKRIVNKMVKSSLETYFGSGLC